MRILPAILLILVIAACMVAAGCVKSPGRSPGTTANPPATVPAPEPATPLPVAVTTVIPQEVVTVIRYVCPTRVMKDADLLFTLEVPAEWNVTTWQLVKSDTPDYRTDLVPGEVFSVYSYPAGRSREQEFRDQFRQWSPPPAETAVTINGIRYDRFESSAGGNTTVAYLARTTSANERGYAGVIIFNASNSNRFEAADFERVVSSFRYFSVRSAATVPGQEIPHYTAGETAASGTAGGVDPRVFDSSDWDSTDSGSTGDESSDTVSTGGSSCGR